MVSDNDAVRNSLTDSCLLQGRFYVGAGGTCPKIHLLLPQIQNVGLLLSLYFFRRTDKMNSVSKGLMEQCPVPNRFFWARTAPCLLTFVDC